MAPKKRSRFEPHSAVNPERSSLALEISLPEWSRSVVSASLPSLPIIANDILTLNPPSADAHCLVENVKCMFFPPRSVPGPNGTPDAVMSRMNLPRFDVLPGQRCRIRLGVRYGEASIKLHERTTGFLATFGDDATAGECFALAEGSAPLTLFTRFHADGDAGGFAPALVTSWEQLPEEATGLLHLLLQIFGGTTLTRLPRFPFQTSKQLSARINTVVNDFPGCPVSSICEDFVFPLSQDSSAMRGALLWGPPGSGKTASARRIGHACGFCVAFDGNLASLCTEYQNSGTQSINRLFQNCLHYKHVPHLVICDEIDAVSGRRDSQRQSGDDNKTISGLLSCLSMVGVENVFVLATSNRMDRMDAAVLRAQRISLHSFVGPLRWGESAKLVERELRRLHRPQAADELQHLANLRGPFISRRDEFVRGVFNFTGAGIKEAAVRSVLSHDSKDDDTWPVTCERFLSILKSMRHEGLDPSMRLFTGRPPAVFTGTAVPVAAAMQLELFIERMKWTLSSMKPFFSPIALCERTNGCIMLEQRGERRDLNGAISIGTRIPDGYFAHRLIETGAVDFLKVIDRQSELTDQTFGGIINECEALSRAGKLLLVIELDDFVCCREDVGETRGLTCGMARTDHSSTTFDVHGTMATSVGVNVSEGISVGLTGPSASLTTATHRDNTSTRSAGVAYGQGVDHSTHTDVSRSRSLTTSLHDPMAFSRIVSLVCKLRRVMSQGLALINGSDPFVVGLLVSSLGWARTLCPFCNTRICDPLLVVKVISDTERSAERVYRACVACAATVTLPRTQGIPSITESEFAKFEETVETVHFIHQTDADLLVVRAAADDMALHTIISAPPPNLSPSLAALGGSRLAELPITWLLSAPAGITCQCSPWCPTCSCELAMINSCEAAKCSSCLARIDPGEGVLTCPRMGCPSSSILLCKRHADRSLLIHARK